MGPAEALFPVDEMLLNHDPLAYISNRAARGVAMAWPHDRSAHHGNKARHIVLSFRVLGQAAAMNGPGSGPVDARPETVVLVDVANVLGSRPDGWWRDRAGAAARLLDRLAPLVGVEVTGPGGDGVRIDRLVAVVEGAAGAVRGPAGVDVVRADRDGDSTIVMQAHRLVGEGRAVVVVTADRGLRQRLPVAVGSAGPTWLNGLIGR